MLQTQESREPQEISSGGKHIPGICDLLYLPLMWMVIEYVGERWTYSESPCTNNSKGSYSLQCCQLCSDIWGKTVLWKTIISSLKFVLLCLKKRKKKHLSVFCIWYLSKRADFKDKVKKKKIINEGKWSDNFSFLTSDKLPQINLSHFFKATHIRILSLPMCDSRNCLEKGTSFRNKILGCLSTSDSCKKTKSVAETKRQMKAAFSWISNNLWIT